MTDKELYLIDKMCPECLSSAFISRKIGPNTMEFHCDICGHRWLEYIGDYNVSLLKQAAELKRAEEEKRHEMTVGGALGLLSLGVFGAGFIFSSATMSIFGIAMFLLLSALMNFD